MTEWKVYLFPVYYLCSCLFSSPHSPEIQAGCVFICQEKSLQWHSCVKKKILFKPLNRVCGFFTLVSSTGGQLVHTFPPEKHLWSTFLRVCKSQHSHYRSLKQGFYALRCGFDGPTHSRHVYRLISLGSLRNPVVNLSSISTRHCCRGNNRVCVYTPLELFLPLYFDKVNGRQ